MLHPSERFFVPRELDADDGNSYEALQRQIERSRQAPYKYLALALGVTQTGSTSYGLQRRPEDGRIDWRAPAEDIDRLVRAVGRPYPGAFTSLEGEDVRIWAADPAPSGVVINGASGQIARVPEFRSPCVVTGKGLLVIAEATGADGANMLDKLMRSGHKRFAN